MRENLDLGAGLTMVIDDHLGGYITGGDPATFYPHLWEWFADDMGVRSVLDVGCGDGIALDYFEQFGVDVLGIDGIAQDDVRILQHDYSIGPWPPSGWHHRSSFDLVWSCEFVEHVEEQHVPNFLETFRCGQLVAMTHATPGQGGHHHVNCRERSYWKRMLAAAGFEFDERLTGVAREKASLNPDRHNHFVRSGLIFRTVPYTVKP